ncbi:MAG TPA: 8-amino-7-oxononanoate synthase [Myxococcaceae bacterium]|nr:8-amino-7-oxononanoate synthase [Myxococcaceae bacterium]
MRPAEAWAAQDLGALKERGLLRRLEALDSPQGPEVRVGGRTLINFSSNDYLGLADDAEVKRAFVTGVGRWGAGAGASRLVVGDSEAHRSLERTLAEFKRAERVLLFNGGYAANAGMLSALCGPEDAVFSDALNHASLIDGCRLSRARVEIYPHLDVEALERRLAEVPARRRWVCTESVFSMDGDLAPLRELVGVCERNGAALFVDEAHGTGVFGPFGEGLCEALGLSERVDVRMGTLGKALGVFGAYAAAAEPLAELFVNRARSFVFSTALPPAVCCAAEAAVRRARDDSTLRERLWRNIRHFAAGLRALGLQGEPRSAIFPVVLGTPEAAVGAAEALRERGLLVKAIRPPTVPEGTSRLRFCLSAAHSEAQVDTALQAMREVLEAGAGSL